jgi:hypothetical protein
MQYMDIVFSQQEACQYLEDNFPDKTVLTVWPLEEILQHPYLGYVKTPIATTNVKQESEILLKSSQGDPNGKKRKVLRALIQQPNVLLKKRFERNGKYVEVYMRHEVNQEPQSFPLAEAAHSEGEQGSIRAASVVKGWHVGEKSQRCKPSDVFL